MTTLPSRWRSAGLALLLPVLWLAGCSSSGKTNVEVTLTGVSVSPRPTSVAVGATRQLTATATYSDGSTANVTADPACAWVSSITSVATVTSPGGLVTGVAAGTTRVTATFGGKSGFSDVTVTAVAPTLQSIAITPDPATVTSGATLQLTVTGTYSDTSTANVTADATFVSSVTAVATVTSPGGLVTGHSVGAATITATVGAQTARREVTVTALQPPAAAQVVFWDGYGDGVSFIEFGGSANNVNVDSVELFQGRKTIQFVVTQSGAYSGGSWVTTTPRDLSAYDALTFWAKASEAKTINVTGFGDQAGSGLGAAIKTERPNVPVTTAWQKFTIPIPDPARLTNLGGLFHLAEGAENYTIWLADVLFEHLGGAALGTPAASINLASASLSIPQGASQQLSPAQNQVVYANVTGDPALPITLNPVANRFFTFTSSDTNVATVDADGVVTGVASGGPVSITATLAGAAATGAYAVTVSSTLPVPGTLPPAPAYAGTTVVSLLSSGPGGYDGTAAAYTGAVSWRAVWSGGTGGDPFTITSTAGTASPRKWVLGTGAQNYVGIEFTAQPIDAAGAGYTTLHVDLWTPDDGSNFQIKLVDFGADGAFAGGDDTEGIFTLTSASIPPLATGTWLSYDLPLTGFAGLQNLHHLAQMVLIAPNGGTVYLDNLYFYQPVVPVTGPATAPAAPTALPADVMSLLSDTYAATAGDFSDRVDSYHAACFGPPGASVADYTIPGSDAVKKYTLGAGTFAIIELIGASGGTSEPLLCNGGTQTGANLLDVSGMTRLHLDVWSPTGSTNFQIHLVNVDSDSLSGPGQTATNSPGTTFATGARTIPAGSWTSIDLDLATGLNVPPGAPARLGLVKLFTTDGGDFYLDNLYFYRPAPFPTLTFDDPATTYTLTQFGGAPSTLVQDPQGTSTVVAIVKAAGAEVWAGVTISTGPSLTVTPVPFTSTKKTLTMRVYSPAAGVPFLLKLENPADGTASVEKQATTVGANAWETLSFDFGSPSAGVVDLGKTYDKLSVFPNFGAGGGASDTTYYVDDIAFAP